MKILARAWDRRHAYELLSAGADEVERETFEAALALGIKSLKALGFGPQKAKKAADLFRQHDHRTFEELRPTWGQEEAYVLASRDAARTTERVIQADLASMREDEGREDA